MEEEELTEISMKGAPPCGRCHMLVARYAPQVVAITGTYHRECYEAWYFGRFGRRPALLAGDERRSPPVPGPRGPRQGRLVTWGATKGPPILPIPPTALGAPRRSRGTPR